MERTNLTLVKKKTDLFIITNCKIDSSNKVKVIYGDMVRSKSVIEYLKGRDRH